MRQEGESGLRLLSLGEGIDSVNVSYLRLMVGTDGGGVRSISQLEIMRSIMQRIQYDTYPDDPDKKILPCEYFDLIGGSGTGGSVIWLEPTNHLLTSFRLLAIMFTKLHMSVDEAMEDFLQICERVYNDDSLTAVERSEKLKECIKDMLTCKQLPIDLKMAQRSSEVSACAR
jgi:hypothetical protein